MKARRWCVNGDGRPVCPPSLVICRECMAHIGDVLRDGLIRAEAREAADELLAVDIIEVRNDPLRHG